MLHKARMKPADIHQTGKQAYVAQFPNSNKHLMELLSRNLDCIIFPLSQHFRQLFSAIDRRKGSRFASQSYLAHMQLEDEYLNSSKQ